MTFHSFHLSNLCRDLLTAVLDSGRNALQKSMAFLFSSANQRRHSTFFRYFWGESFGRSVADLEAELLAQTEPPWMSPEVNMMWITHILWNEILFKTHIFTKYCFFLMLCFGAKYMLEAFTDNILPHDVPSEDGGEAEEPTWISHWKGPWNVFVTMPVFHEFFALRLQRWHEFKKFEVQINYKLHRYDRL